MTTTDNEPIIQATPWDRYVHLMECRHVNRLAGGDPIARSWERAHIGEIAHLEAQNPDFVMRFCRMAMEAAREHAPQHALPPRPRARRARSVPVDLKKRQYGDE